MDLKTERFQPKFGYFLIVLKGTDRDFGREFCIEREKVTIGRGIDVDFQLWDSKVSRNHLAIYFITDENGEKKILYEDLMSTNGTYVNDKFSRKGELKRGDRIRIGDTILKFEVMDELEQEFSKRLYKMAVTDSLTGLYNKEYFYDELRRQFHIAIRYGRELSLIMLDIDNFKNINDNYGHIAGDEALRNVAYAILEAVRFQDIISRFGGDEFCVLLPETSISGARFLGYRIKRAIEKLSIPSDKGSFKVSVSMGIVSTKGVMNFIDFIKKVDDALLEVKKSERSRINVKE
ncbi:MAG: diguanylate cyclase [Candidatus Aminicenantia bacterium]